MDARPDTQALLEQVRQSLGGETYNRLVASVEATRAKRRLRFWQEALFGRLAYESGVRITTAEEFLELFKGASLHAAPEAPLTRADFLREPLAHFYRGPSIPAE